MHYPPEIKHGHGQFPARWFSHQRPPCVWDLYGFLIAILGTPEGTLCSNSANQRSPISMNVHGLVPSSVLGGAEMGSGREETMAITHITWHITPTMYDQYDSDMLTTVVYETITATTHPNIRITSGIPVWTPTDVPWKPPRYFWGVSVRQILRNACTKKIEETWPVLLWE